MKRLEIYLSGKSPSCFLSSRAVTNIEETLDYITGSALRGALAKEWIKSGRGTGDDFKSIFIDGKVSFGNLYKEGASIIPLSAYSCKYHPGFIQDADVGKGEYPHGVVDMVIPMINGSLMEYQQCLTCSAPMKKVRGYYKIDKSGTCNKESVLKRLIYHTSIAPETESAEKGSLYSLEVIEEQQSVGGEIIVYDDALVVKTIDFLNSFDTISLGSDKSRGLGCFEIVAVNEVEIKDISVESTEMGSFKSESEDNLYERIINFNSKLGINNGKLYFTITLKSDAIITDRYFRHKTYIDIDDIGINDIRITDLNSRLYYGFNDTRFISGWNVLLKLPKEDDLAITKGSVFIYTIDKLTDGKLPDDVISCLSKIESDGIGKRRVEGFGRVAFCEPFHWSGGEVK